MSNKSLLGLAILVLFVFSIMGNILNYCNPPKPISIIVRETVDTSRIRFSLKAELEANLKAELKPKTIVQYQKINIDSLWEQAKNYWLDELKTTDKDTLNKINYVAQADTVYQDSVLTLNVKYTSPIPLHPTGYFNINTTWIQKEINTKQEIETILPYQESFFDRFSISVQAGLGQGLIHKNIDVYYGIGISYKITSLFK